MYDKDYYIDSTVSNYVDYTKRNFTDIADDIIKVMKLTHRSNVLDYGCATGGLVKALRDKHINAFGMDISEWAIQYGQENFGLTDYINTIDNMDVHTFVDNVTCLDVLEHMTLTDIIKLLGSIRADKMLVRIPISNKEGNDYTLEVSRNDESHMPAHSRTWWVAMFGSFGFDYFKSVTTSNMYDTKGVMVGIFIR